jgi:DNA-binding IclR family transcriptional regulator
VGSVAKAFRVLEAFSGAQTSLSHREISDRTALDRSTVQRFVYTLCELGYLRRDQVGRGYMPSPKSLSLGLDYLHMNGLVGPAAPILRDASRQSDETVNLIQLDDRDIVYLWRIPGRQAINTEVLVGTRYPAWCTAMGRVALAQLPDEQVMEILERSDRIGYTSSTVTDVDALMRIIRQARHDGYTCASDQIHKGVGFTIAAPIVGHIHKPLAAVGITGPQSRYDKRSFLAKMVPIVMETAAAISATQGQRRNVPLPGPESIRRDQASRRS